jgi:lauroyl/myristoyl acyltransferase
VVRHEVVQQDPACSIEILKHLRSGELASVLCDVASSRDLVWLPFLGGRMAFSSGFLRIARLARCPLVPMLCLGDRREVTIVFDEPFDVEERAELEEFLSVNMSRLARIFEAQILKDPDQWEPWVRL